MRRNRKRGAGGRRGTPPPSARKPHTGPHRAWIILAVCFVILLAAAVVRSVPGLILVSLEREFGWSRETITLAVSVNMLLFGLAGPFLGRLMDLYGPRRIALWTLGLIALGTAGTLWMRESWQMILLWGVVVGLGSGGPSMILGAAVANRWFVARRGLALGILGAAMSAGQLIFTPFLMRLTLEQGWRAATLFVAVVLGVVVWPLALIFLRDDPETLGLQPYGASGSAIPPQRPDPHPMRVALRSPLFWLLALSFGICGLTTSGLFQTHLIAHGVEHGFSEMTLAASLGVMGAADIFGTVGSGWICDRFGARWPLAGYYLLRGASLLALPFVDSTGELLVFSVVYGLNWLSTVPATSALAADGFGRRNVGVVFGWIFFAHQAGAALAAYGASYLRALSGDYLPVFALAGVLAWLGTGLILSLRQEKPSPALADRGLP
ncbi:Sugar phosphate permease [Methylomagnum ishizawai]|uniref:Sugar phosphate permease n=1 Tax=Methylomagnum ishizawai TaxID=1760988 RepID=A0A1Y6D4T1_9GAMM|nr:MFS transporter [Methylomagnum ishizawai]SMF97430.1 Sugar phosphate permease [Methylomagnum ishizawai]